MLNDVKVALRISGGHLDAEVQDLIESAKADLVLSGVAKGKVNDDSDPLVKRAVIAYCKANFGWDNPEADRFGKAYESLKHHLTLSAEYTREG